MTRKSLQDPPRRFEGPGPAAPRTAGKKAVNVSVDAALLQIAKKAGINISKVTEDALRAATEGERIQRFREAHGAALASYDRLIERAGVCGAELYEDDLDDGSAV